MKSTKQIAVQRAIDLLKASGAVYEVHFEDKVYGQLPEKQQKRKLKYGWGELTRYVAPFLKPLAVGATVSIPVGKYDLDRVQGIATSLAAATWGAGNYISRRDTTSQKLEVLRVK
jgi:hypothetical protein